MDLNAIAIAQSQAANQLTFDPEAMDRAVLRADQRRRFLRGKRAACVAYASAIADRLGRTLTVARRAPTQ